MSTSDNENGPEYNFIETVQDCFFYQHVTGPTRIRGMDRPSLLDLILTDEEFQVSEVKHFSPLGASNHCVITFESNCYIDFSSDLKRFVYHKPIMKGLELTTNWKPRHRGSVENYERKFSRAS